MKTEEIKNSGSRELGPYERIQREFPGSSEGGPRAQAELYIKKTWPSVAGKVEDEAARTIIQIFLKADLFTLSEAYIMQLVDLIRTIKTREAVIKLAAPEQAEPGTELSDRAAAE